MATVLTNPENYQAARGYLRNGDLVGRKGWTTAQLIKEKGAGSHVVFSTGKEYNFTQADKDAVDWLVYRKGTGGGAY